MTYRALNSQHGACLMMLLAATACEGGIDADSQAEVAIDSEPGIDPDGATEEPVVEDGPGVDASVDERRGSGGPTLAAPVITNLKSIKLSLVAGLSATNKINTTWTNGDLAGYTWVRQVAFGTTRYLFLMESQSGAITVRNVNSDDTLGTVVASYSNFARTWTSAEIGKHGATTYLYLHNSDTGELRRHVFNSNGTINPTVNATVTSADWQDIGNLSSYQIGTTLYLEGLDPWSGKNRIYTGDLNALTSNTWTTGWTSLDHTTSGSNGYILTYKAAGDTTTESTDATQVGRLAIQAVDAAGAKAPIYDDNTVGGGWTSVRFVDLWQTATTWAPYILFYNANTGAYRLYGFSTSTGLGALLKSGTTTLWAGDVETYRTASETFVLLLDEENRPLLDPGKAKRTAMCVHKQFQEPNPDDENVVGYQFGLSQFGRVVYRRAFGHASVSPLVNMTTRTRQDLGSTSKMITALTVLKLADNGDVDLDSTVKSNLSSSEYPLVGSGTGYWPGRITVRDLLKHTSGADVSGCTGFPTTTLTTDCSGFLNGAQTDPNAPCGGLLSGCERDYENGNFGTLREVIENAENVFDSPGVVQATRDLWATSLGIGGITCQASANMWYFSQRGACNTPGVGNCVTVPDGSNRLQEQYDVGNLNNYSESCGAGGWNASLQEMLRFMAGIQYAKILSTEYNDQLMDMTLTASNGRTALGWGTGAQPEAAWAGPNADQMTFDKGGERGYLNTTIGTLPDQGAYVLLINSDGDDKRSVIKEAYQYGIGADPTCTDQW
jgi:CubicO group peptidase (beta-lactamase class C family)